MKRNLKKILAHCLQFVIAASKLLGSLLNVFIAVYVWFFLRGSNLCLVSTLTGRNVSETFQRRFKQELHVKVRLMHFFSASLIIFMVTTVLNDLHLYINDREIVVIVDIVEITDKSQKKISCLKRFWNVSPT